MHEPREPDPSIFSEEHEQPHEPVTAESRRNARYGVWLFAVYVIVYGAFILIAAFRHDWMRGPAPGGINVAIAFGMFLIGSAFTLSLVYMWLCRRPLDGSGRDAK